MALESLDKSLGQKKNIRILYLIEIFSGFARGSYLVCIGWTALIVSNSVATVGKIFILASIANMISGPLIGVIIDQFSRKHLILLSHLVIAVTMLSIGLFQFFVFNFSVSWLFLIVIIVISFTLMFRVSFDGKIRESLRDDEIISVIARTKGIHLLSTAIGTALVGLVIDIYNPAIGFVVSSMASILLVITACFLIDNNKVGIKKAKRRFLDDLKGGLDIFKNNLVVRQIGILSVVVLPIGQLSNALLSSFIRNDLGEGSDVFGLVDAAWPLGGMLAALMLSGRASKSFRANAEYHLSIMVGVITIVFSYCTQIFSLAVLHGLIGFFWTLCQIWFNGIILEACEVENVGRTRVYIQVLVSFAVMVMCLSPSLILTDTTSTYFTFWGGFVMFISLVLYLISRNKSN